MSLARSVAALLLVLTGALDARGGDWPEFRGPLRRGLSAETLTIDAWPPGQTAPVLWRAQVGKGHAAPSVVGDRVYISGWDGQVDTVWCLHAATGKPVWRKSYPCKTIVQWPGPRATPTVRDGVVYTLGQWGQLAAWNAHDGQNKWSVQLDPAYNPDVDYGFAWSPLVHGDLLILAAGQRGLAVRRADGKPVWGDDRRHGACASPVPFTHEGQSAVAIITTEPGRESVSLVGVEPKTGHVLWRHGPWREKWGAACVDPVLDDRGHVFVTTSEQHKHSARFTVAGDTLKQDWANGNFYSYTGGCVLLGGHLYGVSQAGRLTCLDWETGRVKWSQRGFDAHGSLIAADGKLIVMTGNSGQLVIAAASPEKYSELRRMRVFEHDARTFTAPVYANGRIYVRSYRGELVCLNVNPR